MSEKKNWKEIFWRKKERPPLAEKSLTEEEKVYEEAKKRIYELHLVEPDLFYADEAGFYGPDREGKVWIFGEIAKGSFQEGDRITLLDNSGLPMMDSQIEEVLSEDPVSKGMLKENEKCTLVAVKTECPKIEELVPKTYLVVKQQEHRWNDCLKSFRNGNSQ